MSLTVAEIRALFTADDSQYQAAVGRVDKSADKLGATGKKMTLGLSLPIAGIGAAAIKTEAQFSSTMAQLGVATGLSGSKLDGMRQLAIKTGKDTVFSANEAAAAMLELAKGGMSAAQIKAGALKGTIALAATENMNLADASTIVVNSLAQFGMKAKDASKVADALAAGSISSTASVSSLSQGLSQVGPSAKQAGLSLYDTVGALSMLDTMGLKGADAGTSMKTMLMRLVPTTAKASGAMKQYGLEFTKANGEFKSFPAIVKEMVQGLGGLSAAERSKAITTIFGTDAQRAVNLLIDGGVGKLKRYTKATHEQGAAQKMADAQMSGTKGAIESMMGSLETAALMLGTALAPAVTKAADFVGLLADQFSGLPSSVQTVIAIFLALVAAAGPVLWATASMIKALTVIAPLIKIVAFNVKMLNLTLLSNPIVLVVAALAALAVGLYVAYQKVGWFRDGVDAVFGWLKSAVVTTIDFVKNHWELIVAVLLGPLGIVVVQVVKHWDQITAAFSAAKDWVVGVFKEHWKTIVVAVLTGPLGLAVLAIVKHWDQITDAFAAAKNWVVDKFKAAWGVVDDVVLNPVRNARDALQNIFGPDGPVRAAFAAVKDWVVDKFKAAWAVVDDVVLSPVRNARDALQNIFGADGPVRSAFSAVKDWVVDKFKAAWSTVTDVVLDPVRTARDRLQELLGPEGPIRSAFANAVDAIKTIWGKLEDAAKKPVAFIVNTVYNQGIRAVVNAIPGVDDLPEIKGFAAGGPVQGGIAGRDSVRAMLMPGEHVWTTEEVRRAGGHQAMRRMRELAKNGRLRATAGDPGWDLAPGFAAGGALSPTQIARAQAWARAQAGKPYIWGGTGPSGFDCSGFMSGIVNVLAGGSGYGTRYGTTATFPWGGFKPGYGDFTIGNSKIYGHMGGTLGGLNVESTNGSVRVGSAARGASNSLYQERWHLGAAGPASGGGGGGGIGAMLSLIGDLKDKLGNVDDWMKELTNMGGWGPMLRQMMASVGGQFIDWVNDKIPNRFLPDDPIPNVFDSGGWLMPGRVPLNQTGRPEAVLTPDESAAFVRIAQQLAREGVGGLGRGETNITVERVGDSPREVARATALAVRMAG